MYLFPWPLFIPTMNEREQKASEALENAINNCGFSPKHFAESTTRWHRYLQNELFKVVIWIIKIYGSDEYGYDLRNEYAHETAKKIIETGLV